MQSRSQRIQKKVFAKSFCMRLLSYSILYYILHFSVHKTFFAFITSKSLFKENNFCSSMLYTPLIHLIFLPSLTKFKNILHPESLEKGHNGNNPNLCVWKIMDISREKSVFPIPVLFANTNHCQDFYIMIANNELRLSLLLPYYYYFLFVCF